MDYGAKKISSKSVPPHTGTKHLYRTEGGEIKREHLVDGSYEIRSEYDGVKGTYAFTVKDGEIEYSGRQLLEGDLHAIIDEEDVYYLQSAESTYLK